MKLKIAVLSLLIGLISACAGKLEFRYYTKINADGSIYKRVVAVGDSSKIYAHPFSFDTNAGWVVSYGTETDAEEGDTLYVAIAERTFSCIDEAGKAMNISGDSICQDNIRIKHEKDFRWFFTFHTYSEIFLQRFPYHHLSINDFISKEETAFLFEGDTAYVHGLLHKDLKRFEDEAERKFWDFISQSLACEFISLLHAYEGEQTGVNINKTDSLYIMQLFSVPIESQLGLKEICTLLDRQAADSAFSKVCDDGYFNNFERQINDEVLLLDENDYKVEIETTNLLYDSNAQQVDGNIAKWRFKRGRFFYSDYTLYIKYRTVNIWAVTVSILCIVFLLGAAIVINRTK